MNTTVTNQTTLADAVTLITQIGATNTVLLMGQPGVGKTEGVIHGLTQKFPDYHLAYIDCANLDLGDLALPMINEKEGTTTFAPSERFGLGKSQKKPVILLLDELGKATKSVRNMLLPVCNERRLGDRYLPAGSIVVATTNLASDGVGDSIEAHHYNRMTVLDVANPTAEEWLLWAASNDIAPEVMAFAHEYPMIFDRYDTSADANNPYNFNPLMGRTRMYCSPRSLARASNIVTARGNLSQAGLLAGLAGTLGEAAARDMEAMITLGDSLPKFASILENPKTAALPKGAGAHMMLALMLVSRIKDDTAEAITTYADRFENFEAQALFATIACKTPGKVTIAMRYKPFTSMLAKFGSLVT